jgi:thiol-disulfide isomerase/thioredoxin
MVDTGGHSWSPAELAGKVVVVNVWATWCQPCQAEIPDLRAIHDRYKDRGVVLLGLLNDSANDSKLEAFSRQFDVNYPIVRMDDELYKAFDFPDRLPTTFVYDKSGHLHFGESRALSESQLEKIIDPLL